PTCPSRYLYFAVSSLVLITSCSSLIFFFFFYSYGHHRDLHSFPTRRSSDLHIRVGQPERQQSPNVRQRNVIFERGIANVLTDIRSEEHTSELQSRSDLVCRLLLEKKKKKKKKNK